MIIVSVAAFFGDFPFILIIGRNLLVDTKDHKIVRASEVSAQCDNLSLRGTRLVTSPPLPPPPSPCAQLLRDL